MVGLQILYQLIIGLLFWLCFPLLLLIVMISGVHRRGLNERLGLYRRSKPSSSAGIRIWIHAASIGEIKAAAILVDHLSRLIPDAAFVMTTMTIHGRDFARGLLPATIPCYLAPLDVPLVTDLVIRHLAADVYLCLETELWPLLLRKIKHSGATLILLNGRISDKSVNSYHKWRFFFRPIICSFDRIGAIGPEDRKRFVDLGAEPSRVSVVGNIKNDSALPDKPDETRSFWRKHLDLPNAADVLVCGSTHAPEEELLLSLYRALGGEAGPILMLAPRHLARLEEIEQLLGEQNIEFDRLSSCKQGQSRRRNVLLIDTMGDLAQIFSIATFVFIGGSLTNYGGHNVMEAAIWEKVVFFGPYMQDFRDAAEDLVASGGGIRVESVAELESQITRLSRERDKLELAGRAAGETARGRQGAVNRQAALVSQAVRLQRGEHR